MATDQAIAESVQINRHVAGDPMIGDALPSPTVRPAIPGEHPNAVLDAYFADDYTVAVAGRVVRADPCGKSYPGDQVVVWDLVGRGE